MKFLSFSVIFFLLNTAIFAQKDTFPKEETIIGGTVAATDEFPWQVAIIDNAQEDNFTGQFCAGTILNSEWILTAAHCLDGVTNPSQIRILAGTNSLVSGSGQIVGVEYMIIHKDFLDDEFALHHDLALLKLQTPLDLSGTSAKSISWATNSDATNGVTAVGITATISGWGDVTNQGGDYPEILRKAQVPIVSQEAANSSSSYGGRIKEYMLPAGYKSGGIDSCTGDSGGGLVVRNKNNNGWLVAGIVSWGLGCAEANRYGIYTRVSYYDSWLEEQFLIAGIEDEEKIASEILIYPNPAKENLHIKWETASKSDKGFITIYNLIGASVFQKPFNPKAQKQIAVPVASLQKGIYLMKITFDKKTIFRKVMIE